MIRHIILTLSFLSTIASSIAQTPSWAIEPSYDKIAFYNDSLMLVQNSQYIGLASCITGKEVVNCTCIGSEITELKNGYALILFKTEKGKKLTGVIRQTTSGLRCTPITKKEYYIHEGYPFFSEDLLPVRNNDKKYGFINPSGKEIIGCKYIDVKPFREGYAAVTKKGGGFLGFTTKIVDKFTSIIDNNTINQKDLGEVVYIDTNKKELKTKQAGKLSYASSFSNGEALVYNKENSEFYAIGKNGNIIRVGKPKYDITEDEYGAIQPAYAAQDTKKKPKAKDKGLEPYLDNGTYGFTKGGLHIILPAQFRKIEPFENGYSRVQTTKNKWGVLTFDDGNITISEKKGNLSSDKNEESITYTAHVSKSWKGETLNLICKSVEKGESCNVEAAVNDKLKAEFPEMIVPKGDKELTLIGKSGLVLWQGKANSPKSDSNDDDNDEVKISISSRSVKANAKNAASVTISVKNQTSETIDVYIAGKKKGTLKAGSSKTYSHYFAKIVKQETRSITVKAGNKERRFNVELRPYATL